MSSKQFYKIKSRYAEYYAVIKRREGMSDTIYLGGESFYCLTISGPTQELIVNTDPQCFMKANFPQKRHLANDMIYSVLFLMKHLYKSCRISLIDTSENPSVGALSSYYLAFYGSTWYEKDFNAVMENENDMRLYIRKKNTFNKRIETQDIDDLNRLLKEKHVSQEIIDKLIDLMKHSFTILQLFRKIRKLFKHQHIDFQLNLWLEKYLITYLGFHELKDQKWTILCDTTSLEDNYYQIAQLQKDMLNYIMIM